MYIDFHRYNYNLVDPAKLAEYTERDKAAYRDAVGDWLNSNLDAIIERKFEIEEINYLTEVSDFIKLIREGESLYELGFFTSCVALVGVSAEDFSRYLSLKTGRTEHIRARNRKGKMADVSQFDRLQLQLDEGIITGEQHTLLDSIREKRNDCLHYNENFKRKTDEELKADALFCLNKLKEVVKSLLGPVSSPLDSPEAMTQIIGNIALAANNHDEMAIKVRNAVSHLFGFPVAFPPGVRNIMKEDFFRVEEVDLDGNEVTLTSLFDVPGISVYVDLDEHSRRAVESQGLQEGDFVFAQLISWLNAAGISAEFHFLLLRKLTDALEPLEQAYARAVRY